jgi:hypothetical protein
MPKNPTRMLSMVLAGRFVAGVGLGRGVADGDGTGVGVGVGVGVGEGAGVGVALGRGVGEGLMGVPAGRLLLSEGFTRMRSGRVGSSSVTVQPAKMRANPTIKAWFFMETSLEST